jgi:hypothetical protein
MGAVQSEATPDSLIHQAGAAVVAAYLLTTVHHLYGGLVDSIPARLMVPIIMLVPLAIALARLITTVEQ